VEHHLKIRRFDPESGAGPYWARYTVDAEPTDTVLDALNAVKWYHDGSLALRQSCGQGVCGSDALRINGRNRLACKTLLRDVGRSVSVAPIAGLPVIKDLAVDTEPFFAQYRSVLPYLQCDDDPGETERRQTPEERARFDEATKCILCAACTTSCPSAWANDRFVGPAAIVQAYRFICDSRDSAGAERLAQLDGESGVWRCRTTFNCTDACPRGIAVTSCIGEIKLELAIGRRTGA